MKRLLLLFTLLCPCIVFAQHTTVTVEDAQTVTGSKTFTGNSGFTGSNTYANINGIRFVDGVKYALSGAGIQSAINDAITAGGGEVWITQPATITAPLTVGKDASGSHVPVIVRQTRSAKLTVNMAGFSISATSEASTTVTVTTSGTCNFTTGQFVTIYGVGVAGYNGLWQVLAPGCNGGTTFTYTNTASGLSSSSGGNAVPAVFQMSSGSIWDCGGPMDNSYGNPQIILAGTSVVGSVFQALTPQGTGGAVGDEAYGIQGCSVDGGATNGATLQAVYDFSATFEGTFGFHLMATNFQGSASGGGTACGIRVATVAGASDGAAATDLDHLWIIPTGSNQWFCIDGSANTAVNINRTSFRHFQFLANGTSTATMGTIKSGANGQIKGVRFLNGTFGAATISGQNFVTYNGCYYCSMKDVIFTVQTGTTNVGIALNNNANQQNFGNTFDSLGFAGTWTNLIVDSRAPSAGGSAQTIAFNSAGNMIAFYGQDDANVTAARWNQQGFVFPQSAVPGNIVIDNATQTLTSKTLTSPTINSPALSPANPTVAGTLGYDGASVLKFGNGTISQVIPAVHCVTSQKSETGSADTGLLACTPVSVAGTYRACYDASVSAATSGVIGFTLSWTDSNGNAQSNIATTLFQLGTAAPAATFTTSAASNYGACQTIDVNSAGAAITVKWVGGGTTTAKVTATVERMN